MRTFKRILVAILLFLFVAIGLLVWRVREDTCGPRVELKRIRISSGYEFIIREEELCDWAGIYVSERGSWGTLIYETDYLKGTTQIIETGPNSVRVLVGQVGYVRRSHWKDLTIDFEVERGVAP